MLPSIKRSGFLLLDGVRLPAGGEAVRLSDESLPSRAIILHLLTRVNPDILQPESSAAAKQVQECVHFNTF